MKYVLLAHRDEKQLDAMAPDRRAVFEEACRLNEQDLRGSGHSYAVEELQNTGIAVQIVNGKLTITDGPFGATRGPSIRLFFIQARDLNAAIQIASQMPQARAGIIEVRPIMEL